MDILDQPVRRSRKISLTPMIDVVFLLLIFFMLINTVGGAQMLRFATPSGERKSAEKDFSLTPVFIRADGNIRFDGRIVPAAELRTALLSVNARAKEVTLLIVVEPGAKTQALIHVIEAARGAGIKNISMKKQKDAQAILPSISGGGGE